MTKEVESKGMGIASMVIGIIGFFVSWIPFIGLPFCTIGLVLGLLQEKWTKQGTAIAGVSLNGVFLLIQLVWVFLMIVGIFVGA